MKKGCGRAGGGGGLPVNIFLRVEIFSGGGGVEKFSSGLKNFRGVEIFSGGVEIFSGGVEIFFFGGGALRNFSGVEKLLRDKLGGGGEKYSGG